MKQSEPDIQSLARRFAEGDAKAFKTLYRHYQTPIYRYCLKIVGSSAAGKDAFQETFLRVHENRHKFNGDNFAAWVFRIARNVCLNMLRQDKRTMHTELDDIIQNSAVFSQPAKQTDVFMAEIINQAIAELPVEFREALVLREYDHFSYSEIAEILGIDLSLAKVRVHRARLSLRKKLSPIVHDHYDA